MDDLNNDTSENNFDSTCELTFTKTYSSFIRKKNIDTVMVNNKRILRAEARNIIMSKKDNDLLKTLLRTKKNINGNSLSSPIEDPFTILGYENKTSVQEMVIQHSKMMSTFGSYAYSCSCGSGKTVAGLYLMHKLGCRTLIVSSRNAVNDQWRFLIEQLYPNLVIQTKNSQTLNGKKVYRTESDVYIYSPHWLGPKINEVNIKPDLIIYDEVHSLLSPKFIRVLLFPMLKVINGEWSELPYMMALSATYPKPTSKEYKSLTKIFGKVFRTESSITKIPVYVWDYYDHYTRETKDGEILKDQEARGKFDQYYRSMNDYECIQYFSDKIDSENEIDPTSVRFKGLIMTYLIKSSVYAALYVHKRWNCNVLLMRSVDESSIFIEKDKYSDFNFDATIELQDLMKNKIGIKCEYTNVVDSCSIIVGTFHRLKEGFSVQNITWGICTKFVWGFISRIQLLGRIRRSSNDEELNNKKRIMYVCSGSIPSTIFIPNAKEPHKITYDLNAEIKLFDMENYIRI